jgi:hypothetical protein
MNNRLIKSNNAGGGGCTDIVDNYDPFGDSSGVALYQLNGDANDSSPNAYNGTWSSSESYGTGVFGQSASFNGSNFLYNSSISSTLLNDYTVSFWAKWNAVPTGAEGLMGIYEANTIKGMTLSFSLGKFLLNVGDLQAQILLDPSPFLANQWYHIALSHNDGGNVVLYINNSIVGELQNINNSINSSSVLRLGLSSRTSSGSYNFNQYHNGSIDQVRVFNTALTPLEVEALYTEELCICDGTVDTLDILGDGSCIATYQLDGNANDLSGNYSGTPVDVSYGVGEFDLAGAFNGSSSYISLGTLFNTNVYSFSFWVNPTTTTPSALEELISSSSPRLGYFQGTSGQLVIYDGSQYRTDVDNMFVGGSWVHVCIVANSTTLNIYKNGVNVNTQTITGNNVNNLFISKHPTISLNYFDGSIDQVRIFNKALSSSEVTTLYNETACTKAAYDPITRDAINPFGDFSEKALYKFENNTVDSEGINNGSGNALTYATGYINQAASFNGSSSYIYLNNVRYAFPFSISLWFKSTGTTTQTLYTDFGGGRAIYFNLMSDGKVRQASINSSDAFIPIYSDIAYNDGQWHHGVAVFGSSKMSLYVNGEIKAISAPFTYGSRSYGTNPSIGGAFSGGGINNPLNGQLDQIRIFNKELTPSDVLALYNE